MSQEISLEVKNISTLNVAEANAIEQELQSELKRRHLRLTSAALSEMSVHLILSEAVDCYIWAVETRKPDTSQTFLVGLPRQTHIADGQPNGSLTLEARLIWTQPDKFIDFALSKLGPSPSSLAVLGLNYLEMYNFSDSGWHLDWSIPVSRTTPVRRDVTGGFDLEKLDALWVNVDCIGPTGEPRNLSCSEWYAVTTTQDAQIRVPGHEQSVGTILKAKCGTSSMLIASGSGDWTQPDSLQGILLVGPQAQAVPSGNSLPFGGPVLNMRPDWKENTVRVIVHSLKTGNYEAYLVTATCSH